MVECNNKKAVLSLRWLRNAPYTWVPWIFSGLPDYAHGYYSQHFHGLLFRSTHWMFLQNLKSVALPVPEIRGGRVAKLKTLNLEEGEAIGGRGRYRSKERWWVPIGPPMASIVTFHLSLRVSEILPLLFSRTSLFHTSPLVSPKFTNVPLGVGGSPFGYKERRCWANSHVQFVLKISNMWSQITNVTERRTDGQTDRRHAIARPRSALKCIER